MKTAHWLLLMALFVPLAFASCRGGTEKASASNQYAIKGKVIAVDAAKPAVKLDHEEIPGLMKAMEMEYSVANADLLEGIKEGDEVQGHLKVDSGNYVITDLEKR
jgi:protein SCO1/2